MNRHGRQSNEQEKAKSSVRDAEGKFRAQLASKALIGLVVASTVAFFIPIGGIMATPFISAPIVSIALLYFLIRHGRLLSKKSVVIAVSFLLINWALVAFIAFAIWYFN